MKATIDFEPALYQRLKVEAAKRGRTVRELVAEGVRLVLARPATSTDKSSQKQPPWVGQLHRYAKHARGSHDMESVRTSIARGRAAKD